MSTKPDYSHLIALSGPSGVGKTNFCKALVSYSIDRKRPLAGFYCPAVFQDGFKTGIELCLLPERKRFVLGRIGSVPGWLKLGRWSMDPEAFAAGRGQLEAQKDAPYLLIDEIGPFEVQEHNGWCNALEIIRDRMNRTTVITLRPSLVEWFKETYPGIRLIDLEKGKPKLAELLS